MADGDETAATGTQRLDKWLWFTRLVKSRTLAASLVSDGRVRLNRTRIEKPSHVVRVGDVVTATVHRQVRVLKILALSERRGPTAEARLLYEDLSEPQKPSGESGSAGAEVTATSGPSPSAHRRPTKHERRQLSALKRGQDMD